MQQGKRFFLQRLEVARSSFPIVAQYHVVPRLAEPRQFLAEAKRQRADQLDTAERHNRSRTRGFTVPNIEDRRIAARLRQRFQQGVTLLDHLLVMRERRHVCGRYL